MRSARPDAAGRAARGAILAAALLAAPPLAAQTDSLDARPAVRLDLPLLDLPYNVAHGYRAPSMRQSLAVTTGFYEASHQAIGRAWGGRRLPTRLTVLVWDYLTLAELPLPGADAWLHEEYHRAVMGRRGIDSFNDVYDLEIGAAAIAVSHVEDQDLVRLKREHPAEQVRLGAAGIEAESQLVLALERNQFFDRSPAWHAPLYWFVKTNSLAYVASGTWDETNDFTDEMNEEDGADLERRDFTGHDFTAWVYDLHRPSEPYSARGTHPSGVGIDRYIRPDDLTPEELGYLERQGWLQLLNLTDPFLLGMRGFSLPDPLGPGRMRVNANLAHLLTSFGHTVDANLFLERDELKLFVMLHAYENGERVFPGVDVELLDYPVAPRGRPLALTTRVALWSQPEGQRFRTRDGAPGGLVALRLDRVETGRLGGFVELEGKSAGWVAGNVHLDANLSLRAGATISLR